MSLEWNQEEESQAVIIESIKKIFDETRNMLDKLEIDIEHENKANQDYALFVAAHFIKALVNLRDEFDRLNGMN